MSIKNTFEEGNFFSGENLDFCFELIDENTLYEEMNEKFVETVEEVRKIISVTFARIAFFK